MGTHIRPECPSEQRNNQKIKPCGTNQNQRQENFNHHRTNKDSGAGKRGKLRKIKTTKAKKIFEARKQCTGAAHLTYYVDDDNEQDSQLDVDQLDDEEFEFAFAASTNKTPFSTQGGPMEDGAAMMTYEGKNFIQNHRRVQLLEFIVDCA